jgi:predicted nucleic acid-binding protein
MPASSRKRVNAVLAIDTNLVVRYLTGDDPEQAARARKLIDGQQVFVSRSVMLETEWVLRGVYSFAGAPLSAALRAFAGLPSVTLEDPRLIAQALAWMEGGLDFADALHLASAEGCDAFVTFDTRLAKRAARQSTIEIKVP